MRYLKTTLTGLAALLLGVPAAAKAQDADSMPDSVAAAVAVDLQPIQRRANDIAGLFQADPDGYERVFAPPFLSQIPTAALNQIFTGVHAELVQLAIEPAPPHRVTGAQLGPVFEYEGAAAARGAFRIGVPAYPTDDYETRTTLRLPFAS